MNPLFNRFEWEVGRLYEDAEVELPTLARPLVPLARLLDGQGLHVAEIEGLSARAAGEYLLRRGGRVTPLGQASDEPLASYLYANARGGAIFTRRDDLPARRRFAAAHALGHWLLHWPLVLQSAQTQGEAEEAEMSETVPPQSGADPSATTGLDTARAQLETSPPAALPPFSEREAQADAFAAALLLPAALLRERRASLSVAPSGVDLIARLCDDFLVSGAVLRGRLAELGL